LALSALALGLCAPAAAAAPSVDAARAESAAAEADGVADDADDIVTQDMVLGADSATVRALLADTSQVLGLNADVLSYTIQADAPCQLVNVTARGLTSPIHYTVRRCPTDKGFRESLVSSSDGVEEMTVEWRMDPDSHGTRVHLSVLARVARVPQFLVNQHTRRSVALMLRRLTGQVDAQAR